MNTFTEYFLVCLLNYALNHGWLILFSPHFPTFFWIFMLGIAFFFGTTDCRPWFSKYDWELQTLFSGWWTSILFLICHIGLIFSEFSLVTEAYCQWYQGVCVQSPGYSIWWFIAFLYLLILPFHLISVNGVYGIILFFWVKL